MWGDKMVEVAGTACNWSRSYRIAAAESTSATAAKQEPQDALRRLDHTASIAPTFSSIKELVRQFGYHRPPFQILYEA